MGPIADPYNKRSTAKVDKRSRRITPPHSVFMTADMLQRMLMLVIKTSQLLMFLVALL